MARVPRKCYDTSFFHVIVQGLNKEYIYKDERYIKQYLKFLHKYKEDMSIEILAYCIMNNHAHLLLYTKKIEEMLKLIQKVNTEYAKIIIILIMAEWDMFLEIDIFFLPTPKSSF